MQVVGTNNNTSWDRLTYAVGTSSVCCCNALRMVWERVINLWKRVAVGIFVDRTYFRHGGMQIHTGPCTNRNPVLSGIDFFLEFFKIACGALRVKQEAAR